MININYGRNRGIMSKCKPLEEYAWFVDRVRKSHGNETGAERMGMEEAIDRAMLEMPDDFEIKGFIMANRAEVKDMCLTEYNEAETMELIREEGREEGREETMIFAIKSLMTNARWTADQAMESLGISQSEKGRYRRLIQT